MTIKPFSTCLKSAAVVAVTLMVSGSQCARIDDMATGPDLSLTAQHREFRECILNCQEASREARQAELVRYVEAIRNCDDGQCRREAAAFHRALVEQIEMDEAACKAGCHDQGAGSGGQ